MLVVHEHENQLIQLVRDGDLSAWGELIQIQSLQRGVDRFGFDAGDAQQPVEQAQQAIRFIKQSYKLEDIRVLSYEHLSIFYD